MTLRDTPLPPASSTNWYGHYSDLDAFTRGASYGKLYFDDPEFAGANDAATFNNLLTAAAAYTYRPWIVFPDRAVTLGSTSFIPYSGMKLAGPGFNMGPKNLELAGGQYTPGRITWNGGTGASSMFNGTATYYDIIMTGLSITGSTVGQFIRSTDNMYACQWDSMTWYGFKHIFGNPAEKWRGTQNFWTGHATVLGPRGKQFFVGGADHSFYKAGYLNIGGNTSVAGGINDYLIHFDTVSKTNIGFVFLSLMNGWRGFLVTGEGHGIHFDGGVYEGYKPDNNPTQGGAYGSVIRLEGSMGTLTGLNVGQAMISPDATEHGVIEILGGEWTILGPTYYRGYAAESVPLIYHRGGRVAVLGAARYGGETWTGRPRFNTTASNAPAANATGYSFYCDDMSMQTA